MKLLCDEFLRVLAKSLIATLPPTFTGKVTIVVHFHQGRAEKAGVAQEEYAKLP